ncbi:MAG: EexN family lipoprotein [Janthinobacterium lividum]
MKKIILVFGLILTTGFIISCSEEKTQTVDWYVKHPEILKKEVEKCKLKTLEELAKDKHCVVINLAQREVFDDLQINAPVPTFK